MPEIDKRELVLQALSSLSPTCARDEWISIGMAIHSEWPDDYGMEIWDQWSSGSSAQYDSKALRSAWRSFRPGNCTLGTLFKRATDMGWQDPRRAGTTVRPTEHHSEPAETEPKTYPTEEGLRQLAGLCIDVRRDDEARRWCRMRDLDIDQIAIRQAASVLPLSALPLAPAWTPSVPMGDNERIHGRLLIPLYDSQGIQRSVTGRAIDKASLKMKAARPLGHKASGLCMMSPWAQDLVQRNPDEPLTELRDVVIVEGEPDYLTRLQTTPDAAIIGIYAGSWQQELADRIPDGANVYIETDRDKQGEAYALKIARTLGTRCKLFRLRADLPAGDINDLHVGGTLKAPAEQCEPYSPPESPTRQPVSDTGAPGGLGDQPEICHQWQLRDAMRAIWRHLDERNQAIITEGTVKPIREPLFLTPGPSRLARLTWHANPEGDQSLEIEQLTQTQVMGLLTREFTWYTVTSDGERKNRDPKKSIAEQVHGDAAAAPVELPVLHAVTRTPLYGRDGTQIHRQGYHAAERLWYEPDPAIASMPEIPAAPAARHVTRARELLFEVLDDFPFVAADERAIAVAAILLPFVRRMISGPTPIHLIESPVQGSGKSLLARIIAIITTGANVSPIVLNSNEEESQKALSAELSRGRALVIIDNVDTARHPLNSPALSAIATETVYSNRRLGTSDMLELPNSALWIMTGNNVKVSQDLIRRFVRCRLDPGSERPWMRQTTSFRHPDIVRYVVEHRLQLVWSALILCQNWIALGQPAGTKPLGSYERWSAVIGGIIESAGISGFLGNAEAFYATCNGEADDWLPFVTQWWKRHAGHYCTTKELNLLCNDYDLMIAARGDKSELSQTQRLGRALQASRERIVAGMRISTRKNHISNSWCYYLEPLGTPPPTDAPNLTDTPQPEQITLDFGAEGASNA